MSTQSPRSSKGIFAATLSLLLLAPVAALAADAKEAKPANSGKGRYSKQETEVKAQQTNLTKPQAPPEKKKETRPTLTVDQFRETKTQEIQKIVDAQISKMRRLITVTADDDPQKPDFMFRLGELYAEKQKLQLQRGARARSEDLRAAAQPARSAAGAAEDLRAAGAEVAARGGQGVHRRDQVPQVRAHGRGAVPPRLPAHQREEGRPGA